MDLGLPVTRQTHVRCIQYTLVGYLRARLSTKSPNPGWHWHEDGSKPTIPWGDEHSFTIICRCTQPNCLLVFVQTNPVNFMFLYVCRLQSIRVFCLFSVFNPDELSFLSVQLLCLRGSKLSKPIAITAIYDAMFPGSIDLWWPDGKLHVPHPCGPQQYRSHGLCHGLVSWQPHPERSRK